MNSTKINMKNDVIKVNTYNFLIDNSIVHVKVDDSFLRTIKEKIIQKYGSLKQFNLQKLRICYRSEEHTSELQSRLHLVCRLLLEKKKNNQTYIPSFFIHGHALNSDNSPVFFFF